LGTFVAHLLSVITESSFVRQAFELKKLIEVPILHPELITMKKKVSSPRQCCEL